MSEAEILALVELGLFRNAGSSIDSQTNLTRALRIIRARLETHIGSPVRARNSAEALLREHLTASERAQCYEIVGRVAMSFGHIEAGTKAMRAAMNSAAQAESPKLEARVIASNAEILLHSVAIEAAAEEIPKLRRACIASGDSYSLIALHKLVAEIKAKKGLAAAARISVNAARSLLKSWPNVWQQGRLAVTASGIEIIQSDYDSALEYTNEALLCAEKSGSNEIRMAALGNLAHIKLAHGKLDEAREANKAFQSMVRVGGGTEIGGRDTEMEIALAADDLELAHQLAERVTAISANLDGGSSYHGLWNALTQVRLRYRIGEATAGVGMALDSIRRIERMSDRNLLERMQLLAAEGLGRTGRTGEGAALLAQAVSGNSDAPLEMIAEASRVAGRLTAYDDPGAAAGHFERAASILEKIGNLTGRAEVRRDALEALTMSRPAILVSTGGAAAEKVAAETASVRPADYRPSAAPFAERLATFLELGAHPLLLATETLWLIGDTGSVVHAAVVEKYPDGRRELITAYSAPAAPSALDDDPHAVRIVVGTYRDREYWIVAIPYPTASARATLLSVEQLVQAALTIARARQDNRERAALWPDHTPEQQLGLVCASERMLDLVKTIRRVAGSNLTVLITGETGVGKELFARALHLASPRKDRTFLPFNCTTVPREMIDSQLFGYRRGAFTGANEDRPGLIRAAAGGTLFLDEIGEMSLEAQPKLLRFLESGDVLPLGETRPQHVDVRVVAATNRDLDQLVADGLFREDLYYRLNVLQIAIPPLRERREEIPVLVELFLEKFGGEMQKPLLRLADDTLEYLLLYAWPGNVRQLANEIRRMVALAEPGDTLLPSHLSKNIVASRRTIPVQPTEAVIRVDQPLDAATEQLERVAIERALAACGGRNDEAARLLGLSRKGLYLKRQRLKL